MPLIYVMNNIKWKLKPGVYLHYHSKMSQIRGHFNYPLQESTANSTRRKYAEDQNTFPCNSLTEESPRCTVCFKGGQKGQEKSIRRGICRSNLASPSANTTS
uniref:Uncharacterized protein n=1 Tax=Opuntia streptacantha TaxID=393608 RepID=A0A7C9DKA8_OPUST